MVSTENGYRCRNPEVYALLDRFVSAKADKQYTVDACIEAALVSLGAGRKLASIDCPKCSLPHLDMHAWALEPHSVHTCMGCKHSWRHTGA